MTRESRGRRAAAPRRLHRLHRQRGRRGARRRRRDRLRRLRHRGARSTPGTTTRARTCAARSCSFMNNDPERDPAPLRRQAAPLLRALGLQVPDGGGARRRRRDRDPHDASAGYSWSVVQNSWSGEQLSLPAVGRARAPAQGLGHGGGVPADRAARRAGPRRAARPGREPRDFRPVPLGVQPERCVLRNQVARRASANVIGRLAGQRPGAREGGGPLHRAPRPLRHQAPAVGRAGHLQRRARQRGRRRHAARGGRGFRGAARAPARARSCSRP